MVSKTGQKRDRPPPRKTSPANEVKLAARDALRTQVLEQSESILNRYIEGESFDAIAKSLPFPCTGASIHYILRFAEETAALYASALDMRADFLAEQAIDYAKKAAQCGDPSGYKVAIDTNLKMAAKLNAKRWGDTSKLELTGKDGGALEIKADLSLTAEQAYERLIKGK